MLSVNCRQVGWPDRPHSAHETIDSGRFVFLFSVSSPRQKSQYVEGFVGGLPSADGAAGIEIVGAGAFSESGTALAAALAAMTLANEVGAGLMAVAG